MSQIENDDDCVSKKPWSEVLSRSLKLFTFNIAREGGKSFGQVIFYIVLGVVALMVATFIIDSMTGWFSSWFDFWPFNQAANAPAEPAAQGWFNWLSDLTPQQTPADNDTATSDKWYCKWNPMC